MSFVAKFHIISTRSGDKNSLNLVTLLGDESGDSNENGEKANSEEKDQENSDEKKAAENQNPENEKKDSRAGSPKYNPGIKQ